MEQSGSGISGRTKAWVQQRPDGGAGRAWGLGDKKELLSPFPALVGHPRVKPTLKVGLG